MNTSTKVVNKSSHKNNLTLNYDDEIWMHLPSYTDLYMVSNKGRVKSINRNVLTKNNDVKKIKGIIRKLSVHTSGYLRISLCKNGNVNYHYVHNLIALSFLGEKPKKHDVDHIDKNRQNNNLNNLRYLTYKKNRGILNNKHAKKNKL